MGVFLDLKFLYLVEVAIAVNYGFNYFFHVVVDYFDPMVSSL
jgi:hypothetical protein